MEIELVESAKVFLLLTGSSDSQTLNYYAGNHIIRYEFFVGNVRKDVEYTIHDLIELLSKASATFFPDGSEEYECFYRSNKIIYGRMFRDLGAYKDFFEKNEKFRISDITFSPERVKDIVMSDDHDEIRKWFEKLEANNLKKH